MKRLCIFAAVAGLGLVSAAPPPGTGSTATTAWSEYPPCSRTVTDRCIQLYERGVRTRSNLARNKQPGGGREAMGIGGPYESASAGAAVGSSAYPPCSATVTDRCTQIGSRHRGPRIRTVGGEQIRMAGERG
jgi:hypothetical protein